MNFAVVPRGPAFGDDRKTALHFIARLIENLRAIRALDTFFRNSRQLIPMMGGIAG